MSAWIKVEDKLPELGSWVLVHADGAMNGYGYSLKGEWSDWTHNNSGCHNINPSEITHWQEFPEAPK